MYADDVAEIDEVTDAPSVCRKLDDNNALFSRFLEPHGLAQNADKAEYIPALCGLGAVQHMKIGTGHRYTVRQTVCLGRPISGQLASLRRLHSGNMSTST